MGGADSRARCWGSGPGAGLTCLSRVRWTHGSTSGAGRHAYRGDWDKSLSTDHGGDVAASSGCYILLDGADIGVSRRAKPAAPSAPSRLGFTRARGAGRSDDGDLNGFQFLYRVNTLSSPHQFETKHRQPS